MKPEHLAALTAIPMELDRLRAVMADGLGASTNGRPLSGARYQPLTRSLLWSGSGRLQGWSMLNLTASSVTVVLHDGHDASGDAVAVIVVPANTSVNHWWGHPGVDFVESLYLELVGTPVGTVLSTVLSGSVYLGQGAD